MQKRLSKDAYKGIILLLESINKTNDLQKQAETTLLFATYEAKWP